MESIKRTLEMESILRTLGCCEYDLVMLEVNKNITRNHRTEYMRNQVIRKREKLILKIELLKNLIETYKTLEINEIDLAMLEQDEKLMENLKSEYMIKCVEKCGENERKRLKEEIDELKNKIEDIDDAIYLMH